MNRTLLSFFCAASALGAAAQIPLDYYAPLDGLTGRELKQAVHEVVTNDVAMLSYGSGNVKTWWAFYATDMMDGGQVRDRYSADEFTFGSRGSSVSGMNIEHSFPKSWWGGAENNAYKDLYNLMPCQSTINNHKSNYPMANVDVEWRGNGVTKVGTRNGDPETQSYRYWEPGDQWKGDFARGYFYMATAYQNFTWSGDQSVRILKTEAYPTLQEWAYTLYLDWAKTDVVDEIEAVRNNAVEKFQGNRNPFVDFPNLAQYIWGDSIGEPFNPLTSVKSQAFTGGATIRDKAATPVEIYASTFLGQTGGCTVELAPGSASGIGVWSNTADYGWKGTGSRGPTSNLTRYDTDATLLTPEIDLSEYKSAWFEFDHAVNYSEAPYSELTVIARVDGEDHPLNVRRWPLGNKWTFLNSSLVDLTPWAGKKVKVGFRYTSTTENASTWEVKNFHLEGVSGKSAIDHIEQDMLDPEDTMPEEYFTIDGRRLPSRDNAHGIIIVKRGSHVSKIFIP